MLQEMKQFFDEWRRGLGEWHAKEMFARLIDVVEAQEVKLQTLVTQIEELKATPTKDKK